MKTRLAPTPSGFLHLGNAFNFVLTWLVARSQQGQLHLRIDDIDAERRRAEYVEDIFASLEWLGLDYDTGPGGPDDFYQHHSQQLPEKQQQYAHLLNELWQAEKLFACTCSRSEIRRRSTDGLYPGTCRQKALSRDMPRAAWRLLTPEKAVIAWEDVYLGRQEVQPSQTLRDMVLRRKNQLPAYQLASLVEDVQLGIDYLVRGEDLLASSAGQRFLAQVAGVPWEAFLAAKMLHHPLFTDEHQQKMSKSAGSTSLQHLRAGGVKAAGLYRWIAQVLGLPDPEAVTQARDLLQRFDLQHLRIQPFPFSLG